MRCAGVKNLVNIIWPIIFQGMYMEQAKLKMVPRRRPSFVKTSIVLKESAKDFCENTSLHGFSYWISSGQCKMSEIH